MKIPTLFLMSAAAVTALGTAATAQDALRNEDGARVNRTDAVRAARGAGQTVADNQIGRVLRASELIGKDVEGRGDDDIGEVHDVGVDLKAGRVVHVLISSGGLLNTRGSTFAVPPRALTFVQPGAGDADDDLYLDMDRESLRSAPVFDANKWNYDRDSLAQMYRFYRQDPYFVGTNRVDGVPDGGRERVGEPIGHVEKASKLIGANVHNLQDENIGEIEDMVVDLGSGRILEVIVSSGGFLGIGDELSVVPPTAFDYDGNRQRVQLDTTKEALGKAPRFKRGNWPSFGDPEYATGVYRAFGKDPYFTQDADNTANNQRDRGNTLTPLDQGSSEGDVEVTRNIRKEIVANDDLSVNAKNVKVITQNGRVTLRGPVNSEQERRILADIAARVVPGGQIDNQIEVKRRD